jgi:hypothetical protein
VKIIFSREEVNEIISEHIRTNLDVRKSFVIAHKVKNLEISDDSYVEVTLNQGVKNGEIPPGPIHRN